MHHNSKMEYDVFISYSSADREWVRSLASNLEKLYGLRCFFDEWDMRPGENIRVALSNAIQGSKRIAFVISQHSLDSAWVEFETTMAMFGDPSNRSRRVIPLNKLDPRSNRTLPKDLAILNYIDFRDENTYSESLDDLAREIKDLPPLRRHISVDIPTPDKSDASIDQQVTPSVQAFDKIRYRPPGVRRILHTLGLARSSALEVLINNPSQSSLWLSRVLIGGGYRIWDGMLRCPSEVNYYLQVNVTCALRKSSIRLLSGLVGNDRCFGRNIQGSVSWYGGELYVYWSFWLSFPLYLEVYPKSKRLVRFAIDKVQRLMKVEGNPESKPNLRLKINELPRFDKQSITEIVNPAIICRWLKLPLSPPQDKYLWIVFEDEMSKQFGGILEGRTLDRLLGFL